MKWGNVVAAPVLCIAAVVSLEAQQSTTPADVVQDFHDAVKRGDSTAALELLDPDVVIFESGGAELSREEFRAHHVGADMTYAQATKRVVTDSRSHSSGDVAWVMNRTQVTGTVRDREINTRGTETVVLKRTSTGWRIIHIHWSSRRQR